jgi:hypothetical protein
MEKLLMKNFSIFGKLLNNLVIPNRRLWKNLRKLKKDRAGLASMICRKNSKAIPNCITNEYLLAK